MAKPIADLVQDGYEVVIIHGNGPQVGQILSAFESSKHGSSMPLPECVAMSKDYIGYHLQQAISEELKRRGINQNAVTVLTQVVVDTDDKDFGNPSKPIGRFFSKEEAFELEKNNGYVMREDSGRGWR